jgi:5-methylcytosine-specific restriction endonuclease McrA
VATFPIDHLTPRTQGGLTTLDNLAMACPRCNGHKWKYSDGIDPLSGQTVPLFHPRRDSWSDHFVWSRSQVGLLVGKTDTGRATIARLQMNHPDQLSIRALLASLGLFAEVLLEAEAPP